MESSLSELVEKSWIIESLSEVGLGLVTRRETWEDLGEVLSKAERKRNAVERRRESQILRDKKVVKRARGKTFRFKRKVEKNRGTLLGLVARSLSLF